MEYPQVSGVSADSVDSVDTLTEGLGELRHLWTIRATLLKYVTIKVILDLLLKTLSAIVVFYVDKYSQYLNQLIIV